jgi:hypothetical protein
MGITRRPRSRLRAGLALAACAGIACGSSKSDTLTSPGETPANVVASTRVRVQLGPDGRLVYYSDARGDIFPDFSHAGYGGGGVRLPQVPAATTVSPGPGDDGAAIQAALDAVAGRAPDANGFRGAVLLARGTYEVEGSLQIRASGVVLRGEGQGEDGTVLVAMGTADRDLIRIAGVGNRAEVSGSRQAVSASYAPVGTRRLDVASAAGFQVGDRVLVVHQTNADWIEAIGADSCASRGGAYDAGDVSGMTCLDNPWSPYQMRYERTIKAVSGNAVVLDVPLVHALDARFGGGALAKYSFTGRIQSCGVENLRAVSTFRSATDNDHASYAVRITNAEDSWVRDVTALHFVQGAVIAAGGAKRITVQDTTSLDPVSEITGGLRYPFQIDDCEMVLMMRCRSRRARHDFVSGSFVPGPNVFLDSRAEESYSDCGPHHRYATGTLYDNVVHRALQRGLMLGVEQRGNSGTGHGWAGANQLFWNCEADEHKVEQLTPFFHNWSVGCRAGVLQGHPAGMGEFESYGTPVSPRSLYLKQLEERLGAAALRAIGY